jgi:hypothetical protein
MRKLFYMGLESYEARYTLQLTEWNRRVFDRRGLDVVYVPGSTIDDTQSISVGQVLDAHGRSYFGMSQIMNLIQMISYMCGACQSGWAYTRRWYVSLQQCWLPMKKW